VEEFFARLKEHKLVQWLLGYAAVAVALIPVLDIVAAQFGWPESLRRGITLAVIMGFFMVLVLAWYHGERGAQKMPRSEVLLLVGLVVITGVLMWRVAPSSHEGVSTVSVAKAAAPAPESTATPAHVDIPAKSIAVLPFENLSTDKGNAYFADGMQDLILTKLADIGELKVISRTSTMKYASHPEDLKTIAQQLGVATILEGSVQKAGNQVLINVQLIDAKTDEHLWAESYTRTLDNVFGVEGEVAGQIATALKAKLSPAETQSLATGLSNDPVANDLFLHAEYLFNQGKMNFDGALMKQAVPLYRQAIAKAPDFALARAKLSIAESDLVYLGGGGEDIQQLNTDARAQAEQALALAPDLVDAQLAIGNYALIGRSDYPAALAAFDAALKLRPNDADALASRGNVLAFQGHYAEALTAFQQALASDPRNSDLARVVGEEYQHLGRYTEAEAAYQHALALDPNNTEAQSRYPQAILLASGDVAAALTAVQGNGAQSQRWRVRLLMYQRKYQEALALLASIPDTPDNFQGTPKALQQANLYRLSGDAAHAKPLFEQALPLLRTRLKSAAGSDTTQGEIWRAIASAELGLGHTAAALTAIARSQALVAQSNNVLFRVEAMPEYARLYAEAGRPDLAVPLLDKALATPGIGYFYSPVMLWIDPVWDPIRHDPRFEALQRKYASDAPKQGIAGGTVAAHD
jgi:TolB-like protein/predicted negative regulator of RcsB-dependent stress response